METLISFTTALLFYLLPTLVGRPIMRQFSKSSLRYPLVTYFIIGSLAIFALALIANYLILPFLAQLTFIDLFRPLVLALVAISLIGNLFFRPNLKSIIPYVLPGIFSIGAAFVMYALWQFDSPYPFNWDIYEHQTLVNTILDGRFSFATSQVTDTFGFNGYSTIYHTLLAAVQAFIPAPIIAFWHAITIFHFALVVLVSYLLGQETTNNRYIAALCGILAAFTFDSYISFSTLFFIPQTFTACIFGFAFVQLLSQIRDRQTISPGIIVASSLFLFINHYVIGLAAVAIYLGMYFYSKHHHHIKAHINRRLVVEIGLFVGLLVIIFSSMISLDFLNQGEAAAFNPSLVEKFTTMQQIYGFLLVLFVPIGVSTIVRRNHEIELIILVIGLGTLAVVLTQLPYVVKFYVLARYFIHFVAAYGLYALIKLMKPPLANLAYGALLMTLLVVFITNAAVWKGSLQYDKMTTHLSPHELEAAEFIAANYDHETMVISDPATQHLIEPFSRVNTQGGAYMGLETRRLLDEVSTADNPAQIVLPLTKIEDRLLGSSDSKLLVLSGRYFIWQDSSTGEKLSLNYNIWYPADLTFENRQYIQKLANHPSFTLVYENPSLAILEVAE